MKLTPYPEYKNAGVSWVGSIPAHWSEKRAKYYFKEIDERSQTGDEEMLSVSHITGVTPRSQKNVTMFKAESNVGQKLCQPGDLVINTMWAWMSALGVSNHAGVVSPAYGVYRPRCNQSYDNYYLDHLLRIEGYRSEYICRSTGIRSSRLRLYPDKFLSMLVICPPQEEQQTIARFLKAQDCLFRKIIRNKRRLIGLLKEQKQNVINQAVTQGLNPNVKFKPSGVEWIGDIPEHWEKVLLAAELRLINGYPFDSTRFSRNDGVPLVRIRDLNSSTTELKFDGIEVPEAVIESGDLLVGMDGDFNVALWQGGHALLNQRVCCLRPKERLDREYLAHVLALPMKWINLLTPATTVKHLSSNDIRRIRLHIPKLGEQREINSYIRSECATIDQATTRAQREIELMREYRTRLISDVVTGQVDVRGIEVPEIAEEELLALDEDTVESGDVIDDEGDMDETV